MILLVFPAMFVLVVTSLMSWTVIGGLLKGWIFLVVLLEAGANATALVLANKIQQRNDKKRGRKVGNVTKGLCCESDNMLHMEDIMERKTLLHDIGRSDYFVDKEDLSIKETLYSLGSCALHLSFFVLSCLLFWRHATKTSLSSLRCSINIVLVNVGSFSLRRSILRLSSHLIHLTREPVTAEDNRFFRLKAVLTSLWVACVLGDPNQSFIFPTSATISLLFSLSALIVTIAIVVISYPASLRARTSLLYCFNNASIVSMNSAAEDICSGFHRVSLLTFLQ